MHALPVAILFYFLMGLLLALAYPTRFPIVAQYTRGDPKKPTTKNQKKTKHRLRQEGNLPGPCLAGRATSGTIVMLSLTCLDQLQPHLHLKTTPCTGLPPQLRQAMTQKRSREQPLGLCLAFPFPMASRPAFQENV